MTNDKSILNSNDFLNIQNLIFTLRGNQVIIDRDLAILYGVQTKVMNQAIKRNIDRFPNEFRFQLNDKERQELVTNCDRFTSLKYSSVNPYVLTEQGIAMLSTVLNSPTAIEVSIQIMKAFVQMKNFYLTNASLFQRIEKVESHQLESDNKINELFNYFQDKKLTTKEGIFFEGQIFDAYFFVSNLLRSADESLIIIDNYIDDTVLNMLSKNEKNIEIYLLTNKVSKQLSLDIKKYQSQYHKIKIIKLDKAHDRFLIIDKKHVYHLGASLKDLGKKWFAFSKMENDTITLIDRVNTYL